MIPDNNVMALVLRVRALPSLVIWYQLSYSPRNAIVIFVLPQENKNLYVSFFWKEIHNRFIQNFVKIVFKKNKFMSDNLYFFATFPKIFERNYKLFESPNKRLLESGGKLGLASSQGWPNHLIEIATISLKLGQRTADQRYSNFYCKFQ